MISHPVHNLNTLTLDDFSPGQSLYARYPHNGKPIILLMAYRSHTAQKITADIVQYVTDCPEPLRKKLTAKPVVINIQSCYLYGSPIDPAFARPHYFKSSREKAS